MKLQYITRFRLNLVHAQKLIFVLSFSSSLFIGTEKVVHFSVFCSKYSICPSNSSANLFDYKMIVLFRTIMKYHRNFFWCFVSYVTNIMISYSMVFFIECNSIVFISTIFFFIYNKLFTWDMICFPCLLKHNRYQGVKNVHFSENLTCFVFLKHPFWDSPFCLITDELFL